MVEQEQEKLIKERNRIITELFNSNQIQKKIIGVIDRHHIPYQGHFEKDMLNETFYWLTKYNAEKLIEAYNDNPKRVLALATTLLTRKSVSKDPKRKDYPKHSLIKFLLYSSSIITDQPEYNIDKENEKFDKLLFNNENELEELNEENRMWEYIKQHLPIEFNDYHQLRLSPEFKNKKKKKVDEQIFEEKYLNTIKILIEEFKRKENE